MNSCLGRHVATRIHTANSSLMEPHAFCDFDLELSATVFFRRDNTLSDNWLHGRAMRSATWKL
jgi:hypothetical protein